METALKLCSECKRQKPLSEFYYFTKKGKQKERKICSVCSLIREKARQKRRMKMKQNHDYSYKIMQISRNIQYQCRTKGIPIDLNIMRYQNLKTVFQKVKNCESCHRDIYFDSRPRQSDHTPSIDRIIPEQGYVEGNIAVLCWRCNMLKRDATIEELEIVLRWLKLKHQDKTTILDIQS